MSEIENIKQLVKEAQDEAKALRPRYPKGSCMNPVRVLGLKLWGVHEYSRWLDEGYVKIFGKHSDPMPEEVYRKLARVCAYCRDVEIKRVRE